MDFGEFLWGLLYVYFLFFYFMVLFRIIGDLFSDHDLSAIGKVGWIVFLLVVPFIAMFVYLIVRGQAMGERAMARSQEAMAAQQEYIRQVASSGSPDPAAQIARGQDLLASGAITRQEFDALKVKALA